MEKRGDRSLYERGGAIAVGGEGRSQLQSYNDTSLKSGEEPMPTLKQIETNILALPSTEFDQLRQWFFDLDYERWDKQIEQDIADGKLESLAEEAIAEFETG